MTGRPALLTHLDEIIAISSGGIVRAWLATGLFTKLKDRDLERIVGWLLLGIAALLVAEALWPHAQGAGYVQDSWARIPVAVVVGGVIGMVSSLLGVAGGELIIPTMLLLFGADFVHSQGSFSETGIRIRSISARREQGIDLWRHKLHARAVGEKFPQSSTQCNRQQAPAKCADDASRIDRRRSRRRGA